MKPIMNNTLYLAQKLLAIFVVYFVLNSPASAESCKVDRGDRDSLLSENCIMDGKRFLIEFCGNGKCYAKQSKVTKVKYSCPEKSGSPTFCVKSIEDLSGYYFSKNDNSRMQSVDEFAMETKSDHERVKIYASTDQDFLKFKTKLEANQIKFKKEIFLVTDKVKSNYLCSLSENAVKKFVSDVETKKLPENIPNCEDLDDGNIELCSEL